MDDINSGKINEILSYIKYKSIETIVFDDELSPAQERNISKILNIKVLDRTNLILDIFAQRAKTRVSSLHFRHLDGN